MRLLIGGLSVVALLIVGALVAPQFVDWNKYKTEIQTQVEKATGLSVTLDDIGVSVLPTPHARVTNLVVTSPRQKEFETLATIKEADVSVALLPLLSKEVQVQKVTLVEPNITVEILEDGTPSWQTEKLSGAQKETAQIEGNSAETTSPSKAAAGGAFSLDKLSIEKGQVTYVDHQKSQRYAASDINAALKADSLQGPFSGQADFIYDEKNIEVELKTGDFAKDKSLPVKASVSLPDANAHFKFDGVSALNAPMDVQGKIILKAGSLSALLKTLGNEASVPNKNVELETFLTATENKASFDELNVTFGSFRGSGKLALQNLKSQNPLLVTGSLKSSSVLDLSDFTKVEKKPKEGSKKLAATETKSSNEIVPKTLTLAMPLNVDLELDLGGIQTADMVLKGTFVDLDKKAGDIKAGFKVLEIPGQAKATGTLNINYKSSSSSPKGEVIYADPSVSYQVNGQIGQLAEFLNKLAPDADTKKLTDLYKTAQFDLDGSIVGNEIALKDSTLKLDETVIGLAGSYQPETSSNRAKAVIDVSTGDVNIDRLMGNKPKAKTGSSSGGGTASMNKKEITKPLKDFSLPMDVDFDVSMQKAVMNGFNLEGVRLDGTLIGNKLSLETASVQNFEGASVSVKGDVQDIQQLSGLDVTGYLKTADLAQFANALNLDISKLPSNLNALEASVTGKGELENLSFSSNVKALEGQVDAAGLARNILDNPEFSDLSVRLQHPNLVKALQIFQPDFAGTDSLAQAVNFYSKVNSTGKIYDLSNMTLTLGPTSISGAVKVDLTNKITGISGTIRGKKIALDNLLGEKKARAASGGGSGSGSSSSSTSSGKWSSEPFSLDWMDSMNINVNVAAEQLTYGTWNFTNPETTLKIAGGKMNVDGLKAGVFGGNATLSAKAINKPVTLDVSTKMEGIDLESLANALSGSSKLKASGTVSFATDVKGTGNSPQALINALNGDASLVGGNVVIQGFDLAKLANGLRTEQKLATSLQNFADGALSSGQTRFDTINGDYDIVNGVVKIKEMIMDGPAAMINSTGQADLPKWFINVDNYITLKDVPDLDPIEVKIKGPIDNPSDTFGKNILEDYIQQKIKRKIGKELPGFIGDDATNALQNLGILPKEQAPVAPTEQDLNQVIQEQSGEAVNDNQPVQQNVAPVEEPEPEPTKIEKPEDALKAIEGSETTEEAVENLIKGLF